MVELEFEEVGQVTGIVTWLSSAFVREFIKAITYLLLGHANDARD